MKSRSPSACSPASPAGARGGRFATVYGLEPEPGARAVAHRRRRRSRDLRDRGGERERVRDQAQADPRRAARRATGEEGAFLRQLLTGGLRQGALAGVMVDAVAKAASVPAELARRAMMLSGDLTQTAEIAVARGRARDCARSGLRSSGRSCRCSLRPRRASPTRSPDSSCASVEFKLDGIRIQIHRRGE